MSISYQFLLLSASRTSRIFLFDPSTSSSFEFHQNALSVSSSTDGSSPGLSTKKSKETGNAPARTS